MTTENRDWGYRRIQGALVNLAMRSRGTIANILKERGLEPAPERKWKTTWKEFLTQHREELRLQTFSSSWPGLGVVWRGS
jgi:putative transposase